MQAEKFEELENRAAFAERADIVKQLEARSRVHHEIEKMIDEGGAFCLSEEEQRMLGAFRRFKLRMRRHGEIFTWQTRKPEDVEIVQETGLIVDPAEVVG